LDLRPTEREPSTKEISTVGLDLAKTVFQVHGIDAAGEVVVRRALRRSQLLVWLPSCRRAWWEWRRVPRRITGRAS
jgi:hypothetical protein